MNRRKFLSRFAQTGLVSTSAGRRWSMAFASVAAHGPTALPSADQIAWQGLEVGMFVHFAPNTWQDAESDKLSTPLAEIDPKGLNTDQWAQTAVGLGAKYIV